MTEHAVGIVGTGSYAPKEEVDNVELAERVGVDPEWIQRKTQIVTRRYAAATEATSDLASRAAQQALRSAGLTADQVDYLIVATSTGDSPQPPTSYVVQNRLDAWNAACFDVNVVCSGFVYGLVLAHGLIAVSPGARALVIGADVYSRILDFSDRRTAVLFGDGAGAAVVAAAPGPGLLAFELVSRGDAGGLIRVEAGGSRLPSTHRTLDEGAHFFRMRGREVRDFVREQVPPVLAALCAEADVGLDEVDHFVPHQANGVLLGELAERSGLSGARTHRVVEEYGNMGSASVPFALDRAVRDDALSDGDLVLLAGFGGGMSIGACLLRWGVSA
ncbi:3-oxoacyl-ACP synthase [Streptomyces sp. WAC 01529]|uniref:3-oxoacyl-ACP synthase III family protein n=1 Tax=Streptomyces sp. WAC 01529 TaxID=2203205 RepID=UPI000F711792|nr:ketoacyl-ACP synthase III [Streptomyces sp. WAC 01529]AZM51522.1 3-oxoacyl-ACP synthase [Streptomyces sp. WAC 01529]